MDIIEFCNALNPEDWDRPVTEKWRVKDVISHLVGWEREVAQEFPKAWVDHTEPWFMQTDEYDDFNAKICAEFKNVSPTELLNELKRWQDVIKKDTEKIGEEKIRQRPNMDWWFDEGNEPHFEHHIKQIEKALGQYR